MTNLGDMLKSYGKVMSLEGAKESLLSNKVDEKNEAIQTIRSGMLSDAGQDISAEEYNDEAFGNYISDLANGARTKSANYFYHNRDGVLDDLKRDKPKKLEQLAILLPVVDLSQMTANRMVHASAGKHAKEFQKTRGILDMYSDPSKEAEAVEVSREYALEKSKKIVEKNTKDAKDPTKQNTLASNIYLSLASYALRNKAVARTSVERGNAESANSFFKSFEGTSYSAVDYADNTFRKLSDLGSVDFNFDPAAPDARDKAKAVSEYVQKVNPVLEKVYQVGTAK